MRRSVTVWWGIAVSLCSLIGTVPALAEPVKQIVLIAGPKSHGPGEHEYVKSVELLTLLLNRAPNLRGVAAKAYFNGWPDDPSVLDHADTIAFLSDGDDGSAAFHAPFTTDERMRVLARQMKRGCGLVTFHFSVFVSAQYAPQFLDWTGGYFDWQGGHGEGGFYGVKNDAALDKWHSALRVLEAANVKIATPAHPIASGVSPLRITEEFYYQLRFPLADGRFTPILRVPALAPAPQDQIVAWALQRKDGGRGFGTSMGHFFKNWHDDNFRKLILNALVWTAHVSVPNGGVASNYMTEDEVLLNP